MVYGLLRWRKLPLTFHHAAYLVGGAFIMGGGSLRFGIIQDQIHLVPCTIFHSPRHTVNDSGILQRKTKTLGGNSFE
ncbi:MAG: hypothetical protein NUK63_10980 [Candidatus Bathyarchaeum tardum]|nr:MAG: hypothetical protein NUK63_10980 [Candidatus Bathyarchaeum tardum]